MIILDFETTGLLGPVAMPLQKQPQIIEYTLAKLDEDDKNLKEIRRLTSFIYPGGPLPKDLRTEIKDNMLVGAEPFLAHFSRLADFFCGEKVMAAHNCAFEAGLMEVELRRLGRVTRFPWPQRQICTVEESFYLKKRRLKLMELYSIATGGKEFKGAHRTDADVTALGVCLRWLVKQGRIRL